MTTDGLNRFKNSQCLCCQWDYVLAVHLHSLFRDNPKLINHVDFFPTSTRGFVRPNHGVKLPFN
ncbi:Uncharacterised protein [Vibrio cholerae]|nr:Uncharacterised protein [Vibrio cholerae]